MTGNKESVLWLWEDFMHLPLCNEGFAVTGGERLVAGRTTHKDKAIARD